MSKPSVSEYRKQRFGDLLAHPDYSGNQAALGRALGWKNGAYVWQIVNGQRPVSEDLVEKVETMRGGRFAGWFTDEGNPKPATRESTTMLETESDWPLGGLITRERWRSLDAKTKAAAIAAAESAVMESLIGTAGPSGKRHGTGT